MRKWKSKILTGILLMLLVVMTAMPVSAEEPWHYPGQQLWVKVVAIGEDSVKIAWTKPVLNSSYFDEYNEITGYEVIWTGNDGSQESAWVTDKLNYTIYNLMPTATYTVRVNCKLLHPKDGVTAYTVGETTFQCSPSEIMESQIQYSDDLYTQTLSPAVNRSGPWLSFPTVESPDENVYVTYDYQVQDNHGTVLDEGEIGRNLRNLAAGGKFLDFGESGWTAIGRNVTLVRIRPVYHYKLSDIEPVKGAWSGGKICVPQPELLEPNLSRDLKDSGPTYTTYYTTQYSGTSGVDYLLKERNTYKSSKGLGFRKDGTLNIAWLPVDGASRYEVYVAKWDNANTKRASKWNKEKTVTANQNDRIVTTTIKKFKKKPFKENTHYVYKVVTYATRGGKSQESLISGSYYYYFSKEHVVKRKKKKRVVKEVKVFHREHGATTPGQVDR